jgi:quinol monooxygenase YgiN
LPLIGVRLFLYIGIDPGKERCVLMRVGLLTRRKYCADSAGLVTLGFSRLSAAPEAETGKMITQIAKFKLNLDKQDKAVQALKEMCTAVEEKEPGVLVYLCHRSAKHPDEVVFFEVYKDDEALKAHGKTAHFGKLRTAFGPLFRLPLEVTRLDRIGGFTRAS